MRLDVYLYEQGYAESRARAKFLICEGAVDVDGKTVKKPAYEIDEAAHEITVRAAACPFVSVGGMKLDAALSRFNIDVKDAVCIDIGASTGGFTDCLLSRGAAKVYAVDSGTSQLHERLVNDPRVISMENTNARYITSDDLGCKVTLAVCDVSFISQKLILPTVVSVLEPNGCFVTLIKPQFELDKRRVGRGVVSEPSDRAEAVFGVVAAAANVGLELAELTVSPVSGGGINDERAAKRGNTEYLACFRFTNDTCVRVSEREIREFVKNENSIDLTARNKG